LENPKNRPKIDQGRPTKNKKSCLKWCVF